MELTAALGLTLKPITTAPEVPASMMSDSLIAPTPVCTILTLTLSLDSFSREDTIAPTEPCTSPLTIRFSSLTSPSWIWLNSSSSVVLEFLARTSSLSLSCRFSAISLATFSSFTALNTSPACGTSVRPRISTAVAGPA